MLRLELQDLKALGADLSILGFTEDELARSLGGSTTAGLTDEDDVPALADEPVSRAGDIWQPGTHRIACGDCTDDTVHGT